MKKSIKNLEYRFKEYYDKNRVYFYILIIILLVGSFLRLYQIHEYMTFLGDEGRDVIIVRRLLVDIDPILVGPGTSIGNMYLGPLYYYLMAPALLLANFSPVGPAVMIAVLGVFTIWFVWYIAREWFSSNGGSGEVAAIVSAALYAVSPVVITYSRSSWNPNIMPFFALLCIYAIWRVWQYLEWKWLIILGISYAFVMQSHYLGLLLAPVLFVIWLLTLIDEIRKKNGNWQKVNGKFIKNTILGILIFTFLMSPLLIFDARHGWRNFEAMKVFFTQRQTTVSARPWIAIPKFGENFQDINTNLVTAGNERLGFVVALLFALTLIIFLINLIKKDPITKKVERSYLIRIYHRLSVRDNAPYTLLFVWMFIALIGFGVYKQHIYSHYYGFLFPVPFLLLGGISEIVWNRFGKYGQSLVIITVSFLIFVNLDKTPIKYPPNRQLQRSITVSDKIIEEANDKKFNFGVIAERNYEGAYQYFLEKENAPIVMIDPQKADETVTDQLFVVCELPVEECDPTHHEKPEIANFGWSKIDDQWQVVGITLYRLVHNE